MWSRQHHLNSNAQTEHFSFSPLITNVWFSLYFCHADLYLSHRLIILTCKIKTINLHLLFQTVSGCSAGLAGSWAPLLWPSWPCLSIIDTERTAIKPGIQTSYCSFYCFQMFVGCFWSFFVCLLLLLCYGFGYQFWPLGVLAEKNGINLSQLKHWTETDFAAGSTLCALLSKTVTIRCIYLCFYPYGSLRM